MKLRELIAKADPAYCSDEGALLQYLDGKGRVLDSKGIEKVIEETGMGDTLALFVVREIAEVTKGVRSTRGQKEVIVQAMASAIAQLERVKEAFE